MKKVKKPLAVLATSFMLGSSFVVAEGVFVKPSAVEAASTTTYTVTASTLNVRSGSNTKSKIIGSVKKNTKLSVVKKESNGWYKINYNGKTGYVSGSYVKATTSASSNSNSNSSTSSTTTYKVTASSLNVRSGAGTKYSILGSLKKNQSISVSSVSNGWAKFTYNGKTAYVSSDYLSKSNSSSGNSSGNSSTSTTTYYVTASSLNVRSGAGTKYSILGSLKKNQNISVSSVSNGWAKFTYNGKTAYVSSDYLSKSNSSSGNSSDNSSTSTTTYYVTASSLNVRSGAGTKYSILGSLKKNQSISVSSVSNGWAKFTYNGKTAYVSSDYLSKNNPSSGNNNNNDNNNNNNNNNNNSESDSSTEANSNSPLYKKAIVLDAGHGGKDPGAIGVNGIYEKDVNLAVVQKLSSLLEKEGAVVILTRSNDTYLTLDERVGVVNNSNGEAFLSVHANAAGSEGANGAETYYFGQSRSSSSNELTTESQRLATCIQEALIAELGANDRGVKEGNFHVIRETKIPGALVETGFLTNNDEAEKLATDEYQNKIAQALYTGLTNYFKN